MLKRFLQKWLEIPVLVKYNPRIIVKNRVPDVPRTANGWPTFGPEFFTLPQLVLEARKWGSNYPSGTVGYEQWKKYTDELIRRGYSTKLEITNGFLPDEVPRKVDPDWLWQLKDI